jgi:hypothetical protein
MFHEYYSVESYAAVCKNGSLQVFNVMHACMILQT